MAAGILQNMQRTSRGAARAVNRHMDRPHPSTSEIAVTAVGFAAVAGLVAAAIYYAPDLFRYLKIERM